VVLEIQQVYFPLTKKPMGANKITRTTPACFLTTFVTTFEEIFLKYSWNILEKMFKKSFKNF
jgi:hypothetical protein